MWCTGNGGTRLPARKKVFELAGSHLGPASTTLPIRASPNARHRTRWNAVHMAAFGVLIVDDNWLFVEAARDRLEREGLRVVGVAATSAEALRRAEELRPE